MFSFVSSDVTLARLQPSFKISFELNFLIGSTLHQSAYVAQWLFFEAIFNIVNFITISAKVPKK